ncbi:MAG: Maf family nucleotide pyrophosphatase [Patescibacteria group bacterium]|jgi:septum formation protein
MDEIILATGSPYRQQLFSNLGLNFRAEKSDVDENFSDRPSDPKKLVIELAKRKALTIAKKNKTGIVIGFDSIGYASGKILEKPVSRKDAFKMLKKLSGSSWYFVTGIFIINIEKNKSLKKVVSTKIYFRQISDFEINKYLDQDKNYCTYASGFNASKYYSSTFCDRISGSYNNLCGGLPLEVIIKMLDKIK